MRRLRLTLLWTDIVLTAAIAGFFFAYSASVMRGLDAAAPEAAIAVMQSINATVRNPVFALAFFGPLLAGLALIVSHGLDRGAGAWLARAAVLVYALGGVALTASINVPMNEALAGLEVPDDTSSAARLWADYSGPWTDWNSLRTLASFASLLLLLGAFAAERR